jgi:hypothetical protein
VQWLPALDCSQFVTASRTELYLRAQATVRAFFKDHQIGQVKLAAA